MRHRHFFHHLGLLSIVLTAMGSAPAFAYGGGHGGGGHGGGGHGGSLGGGGMHASGGTHFGGASSSSHFSMASRPSHSVASVAHGAPAFNAGHSFAQTVPSSRSAGHNFALPGAAHTGSHFSAEHFSGDHGAAWDQHGRGFDHHFAGQFDHGHNFFDHGHGFFDHDHGFGHFRPFVVVPFAYGYGGYPYYAGAYDYYDPYGSYGYPYYANEYPYSTGYASYSDTGPLYTDATSGTTDLAEQPPPADTNVEGDQSPGEQLLAESIAAFRGGNDRDAIRLANHAAVEMPRSAKPHELMSLALFALGDYRGATAEAHVALTLGSVSDWATLYGYYGNVDTYTSQLRALEQYVQGNLSAPEGHFLLGYQDLMMGHKEAAKEEFQQVLRLAPQDKLAQQLLQQP
jgi:hypothetical protein